MRRSQKIYVALIGDDANFCRPLGRFLRAAHFQPISYPCAEAFLADTKRPQFDCLVTDIHLAGMSGFDLSRTLSDIKDGTPIVFIAAHDDPELRAQAETLGCAGYLRKTDSAAEVLAAIRRAIGLEDSDALQSQVTAL